MPSEYDESLSPRSPRYEMDKYGRACVNDRMQWTETGTCEVKSYTTMQAETSYIYVLMQYSQIQCMAL